MCYRTALDNIRISYVDFTHTCTLRALYHTYYQYHILSNTVIEVLNRSAWGLPGATPLELVLSYCSLPPLHADAAAMARSRSAAGPLPTSAEKSESGRASSSAGWPA